MARIRNKGVNELEGGGGDIKRNKREGGGVGILEGREGLRR